MKHCKGCSHPNICRTHGCGAAEARANKARQATTTLYTEQLPDGSWCAHMHVSGLADESMATAAVNHMQQLFCGQQIKGQH